MPNTHNSNSKSDYNAPVSVARPRRSFFSLVGRPLKRFQKGEEGVTAVEFAMLAFPFFMLLMAIVETSIMFFANQVLESAVDTTARKVRTGQLAQNTTEGQFRQDICNNTSLLFSCPDLKISMKVVSSFGALTEPPQPDEDGELDPTLFTFSSAGPEQIVQISVLAEWPIYTSVLQKYYSNLASGNALFTATAVFKTEPFGTVAAGS